jgi:3-oxoacyl-(acyl-carrier-protein) synthase
MTAPNSEAVQRCISNTLQEAGIEASEIDVINGHLTATAKDSVEIENWKAALKLDKNNFPAINSLKAMTGHCLAAAGSIESVAAILQIHHNFIFPSINCEDVNPDILELIGAEAIPQKAVFKTIDTVIKASFGFGDVNACTVFKKFKK